MAEATVIASFDHDRGEAAENVVVLGDGTICVSLLMSGLVWCSPDRRERVVGGVDGTIVVGLAADDADRVYAAIRSEAPDIAGIWRRDAPGRWTRYAAASPDVGLNGITFDADGTLYAADSSNGAILRSPVGATVLETWLSDERLTPIGGTDPVLTTGANGLKFYGGDLYVTNSARANVLKVAVRDGRADGLSEVLTGVVGDDLAFDLDGNLYVAAHPANEVIRVDSTGTRTVLATAADGLDGPTAVAVTDGGIVVTSLGLLGTRHAPNVTRIDVPVGAPALPRPRVGARP